MVHTDRHGTGEGAESFTFWSVAHRDRERKGERERNGGLGWGFEISKLTPSDTPFPTRPYPLIISQQFHYPGNMHSNIWAYGVASHMHHHIWQEESYNYEEIKGPEARNFGELSEWNQGNRGPQERRTRGLGHREIRNTETDGSSNKEADKGKNKNITKHRFPLQHLEGIWFKSVETKSGFDSIKYLTCVIFIGCFCNDLFSQQ